MHTLVSRDEFIGESETWHKPSLLQPKDSTETSTEEDALDGSKSNHALGERVRGLNPFESPFGLHLDAGDVLYGLEQELFLLSVLDVGVNEDRVSLGVDVLHHHLEAVEAPSLWDLDLSHESGCEVLEHDAVRGCEEGEYVLDEVLLVFLELLPVLWILAKVDFIDSPEASHLVFVHFPHIGILDRKNHESIGVVFK